MSKKRRQADVPKDDPTFLGPKIDALMGVGTRPVNLGNLDGELYPSMNPFHYDENILVSNREEPESQEKREARLARRLLDLRRRG